MHLRKLIEELRLNRQPIIDKCKKMVKEGLRACSHSTGEYCNAYAYPDVKWRNGDCPLADTFLKTVIEEEKTKKRIGQQKQKRRKK